MERIRIPNPARTAPQPITAINATHETIPVSGTPVVPIVTAGVGDGAGGRVGVGATGVAGGQPGNVVGAGVPGAVGG